EDGVVLGREAGHHLPDAGIRGARAFLDALEQRHLGRRIQRLDRVVVTVQPARRARFEAPGKPYSTRATTGDRPGGARRLEQGLQADRIRVGEGGLVAGDGAHADTLVDRVAAGLHDAFLEAPALAARILEVEVGVIDAVLEDLGK